MRREEKKIQKVLGELKSSLNSGNREFCSSIENFKIGRGKFKVPERCVVSVKLENTGNKFSISLRGGVVESEFFTTTNWFFCDDFDEAKPIIVRAAEYLFSEV